MIIRIMRIRICIRMISIIRVILLTMLMIRMKHYTCYSIHGIINGY